MGEDRRWQGSFAVEQHPHQATALIRRWGRGCRAHHDLDRACSRDGLAEPLGPLDRGGYVFRTAELRQPPVAQPDEMLGRQPSAEQLVVGARRKPNPSYVPDRQHDGDAFATDPAQGRPVAESGGGQDDGVDAAAQEVIENSRQAFRVILRLANQRHHSSAFEPIRDPAQDGRNEGIGEVGDDYGHCVRAAPFQAAGDHIALVAHSTGDRLDVLTGGRIDAPDLARVQCPGHR